MSDLAKAFHCLMWQLPTDLMYSDDDNIARNSVTGILNQIWDFFNELHINLQANVGALEQPLYTRYANRRPSSNVPLPLRP